MDEHVILEWHRFQDLETTGEFEGEKHGMSVSFIMSTRHPDPASGCTGILTQKFSSSRKAKPRMPSAHRPWKWHRPEP